MPNYPPDQVDEQFPALPCEDRENGLYINQPTVRNNLKGTPVTGISGPDGKTQYLVRAEDFMAVQKERDDLKRATYVIASVPEAFAVEPIRRALDSIGIDWKVAKNVAGLVRAVRAGTFK